MLSIRLGPFALLSLVAVSLRAQRPVDGLAVGQGTLQRAQAFLVVGQRDSAKELLGRHLATEPSDGKSWLYLGRIYLSEAQQWHRAGHPVATAPMTLLDFASTSFQQAQELLTDSGNVFRVVTAVERATVRIENEGWSALAAWHPMAEDIPMPPVLAELGRNILVSCSRNAVLLTGTQVETVAVWGNRLLGERSDLTLVRSDLYQWDARYRAQMARVMGADPDDDLPIAIAKASATRPVCLAPTVDLISTPGVSWFANRMVLTSQPPQSPPLIAELSVFHFGRTGLAGSVWTAAARDVYDLAVRRNPALCTTLFAASDVVTLPAIASCAR